ncbi:MAG: restriction endonuclease subunit S [Anaerolineae bacterium]|nr:restriction endonuclease subunit S [Anaerolineae bacterium]
MVIAAGMHPRYWSYAHARLYTGRLNIPAIKQTTGIQNLDTDAYLNQRVAYPLLEEQRAIADYLDRETAQIDALIAAKARLLTLLAEKRRALITRAVTRGLDPHAPLRESGLPWLGQVPAHWEVKKLKHIALLKSGDFITSDSIAPTGDYPVFGGNGVRGFSSLFTHNGDYVLIGRQGALCGNINYASGRFWATEHAVVAYIQGEHEFVWLGELLKIMNLNQFSQSAAQPGLAVEVVANLGIAVPPLKEQRIIVAHIAAETARLDALAAAATRSLALLKERRAALIAAAVTGQIEISENVI